MFGSAAEARAARDAGLGQNGSGRPDGRGGWSGPTGMRGAGGFMSPDGRLSQRADVQARRPGTTDADANRAARAWANRISDYRNTYNSGWDNVGNIVAKALGFREIAPAFDVGNLNNQADWGFDPAGGIAGFAGSAFGGPIAGLLAGRAASSLSSLVGRPFEINLGPSVFGAASSGARLGGNANNLGRDRTYNGRDGSAAAGAAQPGTAAIPRWFKPQFDDPRLALAYQQGSQSARGAGGLYQQAQAEAMRQWMRHVRQALNTKRPTTPKADPALSRTYAPSVTLSDNVAGLPNYGVAMPGYGKPNGYGGTPRAAPIAFPSQYT